MSNGLNARVALAKHEFHFTHSLGQNFILDDALVARIVDAAGIEEDQCVLEIGAGAGVMTAELASRGAQVLALEIDHALEPVLNEVLAAYSRASVVFEDVLKCDLHTLAAQMFGEGKPFRVVANLPYYITADVVLKLVRTGLPIEDITIMVQREAAERIMARPGEKAFCALAATVQYFGHPEVLFDVSPEAFTPRPHVESRLLHIALYGSAKPATARNEAMLLKLIAAAFAMRRKTMANNLSAAFSIERVYASELLAQAGLDERIRGEALSVAQLCALADILTEAGISCR